MLSILVLKIYKVSVINYAINARLTHYHLTDLLNTPIYILLLKKIFQKCLYFLNHEIRLFFNSNSIFSLILDSHFFPPFKQGKVQLYVLYPIPHSSNSFILFLCTLRSLKVWTNCKILPHLRSKIFFPLKIKLVGANAKLELQKIFKEYIAI